MKKWFVQALFTLIVTTGLAQKPSIHWGEEFKLRRGSTDLEVIQADKTGVYLQEGHLTTKNYIAIGGSFRISARLIKLDSRLSELYNTDFSKELKGKDFLQFFPLKEKLFILASEYDKKNTSFVVHAAEINKNTGEMKSGWKELVNIRKKEKGDDINFRIIYNPDSTTMVVVSSLEGKSNNIFNISGFNEALRATANPVSLSNEFDPKTYQLEDLIYTSNNRIVLVGRIYEYREGKKKKGKFLDFARYNIRIYDPKGTQLKELNTTVNGKWLNSTKIVQEKNEALVLAGFYSKDRKDKTIDGMLLQKIDPVSCEVISTVDKQLNLSMLDTLEETSDEEESGSLSKEDKKEREKLEKIKNEGEALSTLMKFRKIHYDNDGGLIILAEKLNQYNYTSQTYTPGANGMPGQWTPITYSVYESGDILMCRIDRAQHINWVRIIPKFQREVFRGGSWGYSEFSSSSFFDLGKRPYYSGFNTLQSGNTITLFFNDNSRNEAILQPGQTPKKTTLFNASHCFTITLDALTGTYNRNYLFSNTETPTAMPRNGTIFGKEMYLVGKDDRIMAKSKIAVGKIALSK